MPHFLFALRTIESRSPLCTDAPTPSDDTRRPARRTNVRRLTSGFFEDMASSTAARGRVAWHLTNCFVVVAARCCSEIGQTHVRCQTRCVREKKSAHMEMTRIGSVMLTRIGGNAPRVRSPNRGHLEARDPKGDPESARDHTKLREREARVAA